jgi:diacylglycerol kinase (ATP)
LHVAPAACRAKKSCAAARFYSAANRPIDRAVLARLAPPPDGYRPSPLARICSIPYTTPAFPRLPPSRIFIVKRLFSATINSLRAIGYGFRSEAALREEMIALVAGLVAALFIAPTVAWYVAMIASLLGLLAVEFLNTAIEKLSDHVTPEHHKAIGRIKDYGSAAVFSAICLAGLIWLAALATRCGLI